jgi:cellulose 1,4-beta-cellobiosidase
LKSATVNGGPYTGIFTNATTGYTNTGLANGTTYYYVVTATNTAGESANSSQASATPQIVAPTGLSATAGGGQVSLSWSASAGAASYAVKRSTVNGGPYTSIVTNATTTYTNTGLANNTTYYFVVSALNGPSESANSSQASATPVAGAAIVIVDAPSTLVTGSSATTVTTPVKVTPGANCLVVLINNMKETSAAAWTVTWNGQTITNAVVLQSGSTGAKS